MKHCRILIADDHELARSGLIAVLASASDLEIVAEAADGGSAVILSERLRPDVALLDIRMGDMDGLEAAAQIRIRSPETRIIMLTMHDSVDYLEAAIKAGASGYALKDIRRDELLQMIANVAAGQSFFNLDLMRRLLRRVSPEASGDLVIERLTAREREILARLTTGETNKEIAKTLAISPGTVKVHVERILYKLGVADRTQAAVMAVRAGLVDRERL
ncbi:response regulator transcription factor [Agrobacterium tumefaciens]|uniref:response regulator n=1 Tax=Agrobacterium TaxID=357 RepID=UPI000F9D647F|nr:MULTISPECIES: response regulator transcription factor [Agrobacterium]MDA5241529.1 response regulator transcription factor [Agrobacterium sp. MAFF310724]MDA5249299.1 response regulator transcription factor [Agrobacterium sp. MAFF210268]MDO3445642.1 response regulator transcription factor [Agrobacterium sp. V1]TRB13757.1 response regulator transcription factor [Agrobacterium tumefaciens]